MRKQGGEVDVQSFGHHPIEDGVRRHQQAAEEEHEGQRDQQAEGDGTRLPPGGGMRSRVPTDVAPRESEGSGQGRDPRVHQAA